MKYFVHVADASVLLNNIVSKDYLTHRIIGGDINGKESKGKFYLAESDFESLRRMLFVRDFSYASKIEMRIDYLDLNKTKIKGSIIDIGGGGAGVIEKKFGKNVIAVDKSLRELEETKNISLKTVSDGRFLPFRNESFDNGTAFFAFMYMPVKTRIEVMKELYRVLRNKGRLYIFEPRIICGNYKPITLLTVNLKIKVNSDVVSTGYGSILAKGGQTIAHFVKIAKISGFALEKSENKKSYLSLVFKKI
ncbi:MAG: class I SAM-dependent methyltransferase [bacterium]